jgi:AraC family transcriptional regulator, transcriptional activator of the genes for pyochelin and ferripyochelin receptors
MKMTERIRELDDFLILTEDFLPEENIIKLVKLDKEMIGFVFYISGNISVDVSLNNKTKSYLKNTGDSSSFYYSPNETVIKHQISNKIPLKKVSIFITLLRLIELLKSDEQIYASEFKNLLNPETPFVEGHNFLQTPEMQIASQKIMNCQYSGITMRLFLESQATELLSHYFNQIIGIGSRRKGFPNKDIEKLYYAKELLLSKIDTPPSLSELSKLSGLNSFKLKTGFKDVFGMPVYKYLQNERMKKSFELLETRKLTIQEVAFFVGYESISSFSSAFYKKYGFRPSSVK